jgi:hypothetical protein
MTRDKSGKLKDTGVRFSDIAGACAGFVSTLAAAAAVGAVHLWV